MEGDSLYFVHAVFSDVNKQTSTYHCTILTSEQASQVSQLLKASGKSNEMPASITNFLKDLPKISFEGKIDALEWKKTFPKRKIDALRTGNKLWNIQL
jgi:hypothetical protein